MQNYSLGVCGMWLRSTQKRIMNFSFFCVCVCVGFSLLTLKPVHADSKESVMSKLKKGLAVRDHKQLREKRFELSLGSDFSMNDVFNRNILLGANAQYYLTNYFGLALHFGYGLNTTTSLADRIKEERPQRVTEQSFSGVGLLTGLDAVFVPAFGKFSMLGIFTSHYDISLSAGVGMIQVSGDAFGTWSLAPNVGIASHFFLSDSSAIKLQVKDYIYSRSSNVIPVQQADGGVKTTQDESWGNHFFVNLSYCFFFGKVRVVN